MVTKLDPIGAGIVCPFRRDGKGDFANSSGLPLLKSDVGELLGLVGPSSTEPGELPWDTARGSQLPLLRHRQMNSELVRALADQLATGVLRLYEPRVRPGRISVEAADDNTLSVRIEYRPLAYARSDANDSVDTLIGQGAK